MRYKGRCFNCGRIFTKSRSDQLFCCPSCRRRYSYIPAPRCSECADQCAVRDEKRKYAPADCRLRRLCGKEIKHGKHRSGSESGK